MDNNPASDDLKEWWQGDYCPQVCYWTISSSSKTISLLRLCSHCLFCWTLARTLHYSQPVEQLPWKKSERESEAHLSDPEYWKARKCHHRRSFRGHDYGRRWLCSKVH